MSVEAVYYHLLELGASVSLTGDLRSLEVDAPAGALTPEMAGLLREHKGALVDLLFEMREREAIEAEGLLSYDPTLPDVIAIPACVPNTVAEIARCIDAQRVRASAA
jgi:hypothetical protein